ncbi:toxin glutamine deamidase domain-containing protein [Streptomyces sp. XM4193]|uniref:toxin glutamine deamidase domain-containing protein n=1 Tax=Streptomyces sp. XM4193 TaxID=2929782 RepID=UPI001FF89BF7|nr:toxin glutamine deamidase domain-containing protein [Streptomyces sp. XM4193]MCK1796236.1 toxin glutamine deamidase domain-containing protein [Streptomyces sp. XM4193]
MMMLDPKLEWVLEMLGYRWPTGDEDKLRSCAMVWRNFAASVDEIQVQGVHAAGNVLSQNSGDAIEGFQESWKKFSGNGSGYLDDAKRGAELIAATLDAAAMIVTMLKIAVIIQLIALAVQLAAAAAAAPFTFGASSAAGAAATQLARITVRRLLKEAAQVMLQAVLQAAKEPFVTALQKMTTDLVAQTVNQKFGAQDGYDAGRTVQAGKEGFKEGVDNAGTALGEGLRDGAGSRAGRGARGGLESAADRSGGDDGTGGSGNGGSDNGGSDNSSSDNGGTRQGSSDDGGTSGDSSGNAGSGNDSGTGGTSGTGSTPGTGTRDGGGEGGRSGAPSTGGNNPGGSAPNGTAPDGTSPSDSTGPGSRPDSSDAAANYPRPADTSHQPYRDNPFDAPRQGEERASGRPPESPPGMTPDAPRPESPAPAPLPDPTPAPAPDPAPGPAPVPNAPDTGIAPPAADGHTPGNAPSAPDPGTPGPGRPDVPSEAPGRTEQPPQTGVAPPSPAPGGEAPPPPRTDTGEVNPVTRTESSGAPEATHTARPDLPAPERTPDASSSHPAPAPSSPSTAQPSTGDARTPSGETGGTTPTGRPTAPSAAGPSGPDRTQPVQHAHPATPDPGPSPDPNRESVDLQSTAPTVAPPRVPAPETQQPVAPAPQQPAAPHAGTAPPPPPNAPAAPNPPASGGTSPRRPGEAARPPAQENRSRTAQPPGDTGPPHTPPRDTPPRDTAVPAPRRPGDAAPQQPPHTPPTAARTPRVDDPAAQPSRPTPQRPGDTPSTPDRPDGTPRSDTSPSQEPGQQPTDPRQRDDSAGHDLSRTPDRNRTDHAPNQDAPNQDAPNQDRPEQDPNGPAQRPARGELDSIRAQLDVRPGGLGRVDPGDQQRLDAAVPRDPNGAPQRFPDPYQSWSRLQNDGGIGVPGRSNNCADCSRSFLSTWFGDPQVSAPRTLDSNRDGTLDRQSPERDANANMIRWAGAPHQYAGRGEAGYQRIADDLRRAGPGSAAVVQVNWRNGGGHAFNAVNHNGRIVWVDTQSGEVSDSPLHTAQATDVFHIPLDANQRPLYPAPEQRGEQSGEQHTPPNRADGQPHDATPTQRETSDANAGDNRAAHPSTDRTTPPQQPPNAEPPRPDRTTQDPETPDARRQDAVPSGVPRPDAGPDSRTDTARPPHNTPTDTNRPDPTRADPTRQESNGQDAARRNHERPDQQADRPRDPDRNPDPNAHRPNDGQTPRRDPDPAQQHRPDTGPPRDPSPIRDQDGSTTRPRNENGPDRTHTPPADPHRDSPHVDRPEHHDAQRTPPNEPTPNRHNDLTLDQATPAHTAPHPAAPHSPVPSREATAARYLTQSVDLNGPTYGRHPIGPAEPAARPQQQRAETEQERRDRERDEAGMSIVHRQLKRVNDPNDEFYNKYYRQNNGYRLRVNSRDENGNLIPQICKNGQPPPMWIAASDVPPAIQPTYHAHRLEYTNIDSLSPENRAKLEEMVRERARALEQLDKAKANKNRADDAYKADETPENLKQQEAATAVRSAANKKVTDIGEEFGELTASAHAMAEQHPEATLVAGGVKGNRRFDQVWMNPDGTFIVVEAKGPSASLDDRYGHTGQRVSQGTREYFETIIKDMKKRSGDQMRSTDKETRGAALKEDELADALESALNAEPLAVKYVAVKPRVKQDAYAGYVLSEFNIDKGMP